MSLLACLLSCLLRGSAEPPAPPAPAEALPGIELLRWRLRLGHELKHGSADAARSILAQLLGGNPSQHWCRAVLALDLRRLRLVDPAVWRSLPAHLLEVEDPTELPADPALQTDWLDRRMPYVDPRVLASVAVDCQQRGSPAEALSWIEVALPLTPAIDPEYLVLVRVLVDLGTRQDEFWPLALRLLEQESPGTFVGSQDVLFWQQGLEELTGFLPPGEALTVCDRLLHRGGRGRLALAVQARRALLSAAPPREDWSLLDAAVDGCLDHAAVLRRQAQALLVEEKTRARGLQVLEQAADAAPGSFLQMEIVGELLVQWSRRPDLAARTPELLARFPALSPQQGEGLIASLDVALDILLASGHTATLQEMCRSLQEVFTGHPFAARLLQVEGQVAASSAARIERYQRCLEITAPDPLLPLAPQLSSLGALASLLPREQGADALARWLALSSPPQQSQVQSLRPFATLLEWRHELGVGTDEVAQDLLLLLEDETLSPDGPSPALDAFASLLSDATLRHALQRCLAGHLRDAGSGNAELTRLQGVQRAVRRYDPILREIWERAEPIGQRTDAEIYELVGEALDHGSAESAVQILKRARASSTELLRTRPPERLLQQSLELAGSTRRDEFLAVLCQFLAPHEDLRVQRVLARRLEHATPPLQTVLLDALATQWQAANPQARGQCAAEFDWLLRRLSEGKLEYAGACLELDAARTEAALIEWCQETRDVESVTRALRRLLKRDPDRAEKLCTALRNCSLGTLQEALGRLAPAGNSRPAHAPQ